mgnify:CR=1 FL=1
MTKILVVDDDSAINELIKINLELQGYEVIQAYNGVEGFAKAKQEEPSLIVLDVMMPEVDGYTVARRIRQCKEIAEVPIIMLTALSELNNKVEGFDIGVDDYLTKPFEIDEINDKIQKLTPIEFDIFNLLFQNHGNMVSGARLLKEIWGYDPDDNVETIRVHIRHLRSKIDKIADGKKYIETIYGGGYKLNI